MKKTLLSFQKYAFALVFLVFSVAELTAETTKTDESQKVVPTKKKSKKGKEKQQEETPVAQQTEKTEISYSLQGIALFAGAEPVSALIREITKSPYSHVGALLSIVGEEVNDDTKWVCFEATGSADDILIEHKFPHVRISQWSDLKLHYGGGVWLRKFEFEEGKTPSPEKVTKFVNKYNGRDYETNFFELIRAADHSNTKPDMSTVFCSELVAQMLKKLGVMEKDDLSDNYTPKQFSTAEKAYPIKLIGAQLTPEMTIKKQKSGMSCILI